MLGDGPWNLQYVDCWNNVTNVYGPSSTLFYICAIQGTPTVLQGAITVLPAGACVNPSTTTTTTIYVPPPPPTSTTSSTTTTTTLGPGESTTTTSTSTSTTSTSSTTTTTTLSNCACIRFTNIDPERSLDATYRDCKGDFVTQGVKYGDYLKVCGSEPSTSDPNLVYEILGECVNEECLCCYTAGEAIVRVSTGDGPTSQIIKSGIQIGGIDILTGPTSSWPDSSVSYLTINGTYSGNLIIKVDNPSTTFIRYVHVYINCIYVGCAEVPTDVDDYAVDLGYISIDPTDCIEIAYDDQPCEICCDPLQPGKATVNSLIATVSLTDIDVNGDPSYFSFTLPLDNSNTPQGASFTTPIVPGDIINIRVNNSDTVSMYCNIYVNCLLLGCCEILPGTISICSFTAFYPIESDDCILITIDKVPTCP
jgi:hypothetical protein